MSLKNSLNKTNLDTENPLPNGGPKNYPDYDHFQRYNPNNTYLDNFEEEASVKSGFGITGDQPNNSKNIFKNGTSLDVENSLPNGGPNRTNAGSFNIPSGQYPNISTGGPVINEDGNVLVTQLHHYLNDRKYIDTLSPDIKPSNA